MPFSWVHLLLIVLMIGVLINFAPARSATVDPFLLLAFLPVVVVLHEMGHAVASFLVGHRILAVGIGVGPGVAVWLGRLALAIGLLPVGGYVVSGSVDPRGYRSKRLFVGGAGLAVNALLIAASPLLDGPSGTAGFFALANVLVLVENLVPYTLKTAQGPIRTDGLGLLRTALDSEWRLREERGRFAVVAATLAGKRHDWEDAQRIADEAFVLNPGSQALRTWLGETAAASGDQASARAIFRELVDEDMRAKLPTLASRDVVSRATHLNNLAWADLMLDDAGLVDEALEASAGALAMLPDHPGIRATRAFALIVSARPGEGIELGRAAYAKTKEARARASLACVLAIGYARDWRFRHVERWIAQARRWDPDCQLLERARSEFEERRGGPGAVVESG